MEATEKKEIYFYVYNVFWKDDQNINSKYWYSKIFLSFKEAKAFAKSKKDKLIPLKPYIIRTADKRMVNKTHREFELVPDKAWRKDYPNILRYIEYYYEVFKV